ncbi:MAG: helix-turn-helix transcriptional regulator [Tidjanibacter sp.]|nr:helix-turn-helix transcriptional regulator [Tidjanibacter sp.]
MNTANNALTEAVYYILLALVEPMHGYGIMQQTAALSNGRVRLSAGTLYGALASLLDKGWIEQLPDDGRKKDYRITAAGRKVLEQELLRLAELLENGRNILNSPSE